MVNLSEFLKKTKYQTPSHPIAPHLFLKNFTDKIFPLDNKRNYRPLLMDLGSTYPNMCIFIPQFMECYIINFKPNKSKRIQFYFNSCIPIGINKNGKILYTYDFNDNLKFWCVKRWIVIKSYKIGKIGSG